MGDETEQVGVEQFSDDDEALWPAGYDEPFDTPREVIQERQAQAERKREASAQPPDDAKDGWFVEEGRCGMPAWIERGLGAAHLGTRAGSSRG